MGYESCLIQILNGNSVKAMPGLVPVPNSGSFIEKKKKIKVAKLGTPKKEKVMFTSLNFLVVYGEIFVILAIGRSYNPDKSQSFNTLNTI